MKISIVIPLYNLEKLIGKCIQSTLDQDLKPEEYEVLVVNDGSTDGSFAAAEKAAQGHSNVRVFSKPNEGLSRTRNYGTDRAQGQCIIYLDADDYLSPNVLGCIARTMQKGQLDMLSFDLSAVDEQGVRIPFWSDGVPARNGLSLQSGRDFLQRGRFLQMVVTYAYDRAFLNRHQLRMAPIGHEDEEFTPRALYFAQRIQYIPLRVYNYLQRGDSFTKAYKPENYFEVVKGMKSLSDFATGIESTDPEGARIIREHIAPTLFGICRKSVETRSGNTRQIIERSRQAGLFPLQFRKSKFRYKLLNFNTSIFILYYRLHN